MKGKTSASGGSYTISPSGPTTGSLVSGSTRTRRPVAASTQVSAVVSFLGSFKFRGARLRSRMRLDGRPASAGMNAVEPDLLSGTAEQFTVPAPGSTGSEIDASRDGSGPVRATSSSGGAPASRGSENARGSQRRRGTLSPSSWKVAANNLLALAGAPQRAGIGSVPLTLPPRRRARDRCLAPHHALLCFTSVLHHGPPRGPTPRGGGSGGPVRPASLRHWTTSRRSAGLV